MSEPTTLGSWLRRERERRGVTLAKISEETKVAVPLLEGLEADDLSRWPGGIYRRAFTRSYAVAIGLDPELVVRRVEEEHPSEPVEATSGSTKPRAAEAPDLNANPNPNANGNAHPNANGNAEPANRRTEPPHRRPAAPPNRPVAVALDLLVAGAIGFGFAAAGSRLLWPVILIAAYHAAGVWLTGTTPMMALLRQPGALHPAEPVPAAVPETAVVRRLDAEPRHVRRTQRTRRPARSEQQAAGGRR